MVRKASPQAEDAFLSAIIEQPDDDVPRLVFADFLEERGNPRGTFIRAQCERAKLTRHDRKWKDLLAQEAAIFKEHETVWSAPIRRYAEAVEFRRGFIEHVRIPASKFLKNADRLFRLAPIRSVQLNWEAAHIPPFADCPQVGRLTALDISQNGTALGSKSLRILTNSPFVAQLTTFRLNRCEIGPSGAEVMANAPHLARLRSLSVSHNAIGEAGAGMLAASPYLANLRELNLTGNHLLAAGASALAVARTFRLAHLELGRNDIGNQGAAALAASAALADLRTLHLRENAISNLGVEAIARSPHLGRLEHLDLESNRINDRGIHALAASTTLRELVYFNVGNNEFGPNAAQALTNSRNFPNLGQLLLGQHGAK